jgi:hypothetical protein
LREGGIVQQLQARRRVPRLRGSQASKQASLTSVLHQVAPPKRATLVSGSDREYENDRPVPFVREFKCRIDFHAFIIHKSGVH